MTLSAVEVEGRCFHLPVENELVEVGFFATFEIPRDRIGSWREEVAIDLGSRVAAAGLKPIAGVMGCSYLYLSKVSSLSTSGGTARGLTMYRARLIDRISSRLRLAYFRLFGSKRYRVL